MFTYNSITGDGFNILNNVPIFQFLSDDPGESQENECINAIGNHAATSHYHKITAQPGYWYVISAMISTIRDNGKFASGFYGKDVVLTNGINLVNGDDKRPEWVITKVPIKTNPDWGIYCSEHSLSNYGIGNEQLSAIWTFGKMGRPVVLDGDLHEYAGIKLNDNFTALLAQYFCMQGMRVPKKEGF